MKDYRWESGICSILVILLFFIHCETTFAVGTIKVHKGYLKYERGTAIKYASTYWHSINWTGGYYNYRGLGGDCANFVSQIFIAGGIRELTKNLDPNIIGIGNVIKGAQELSSRLVNFPLTWIPVMEGANVVSSTSELENGDPSFITGTTSKGGHWYHILVLNNQTAEGVTGHTPYEFYPYPREKWDIQETHIDPNGSVLQSYKKTILALGLAVEYYDFSSPPGYPSTTWLIPTLGNAYPNPPFTTHFIHIPDVPVVTKIELVEINSKDGSTDGFYYRAFLDDTKNSGDGEIERSNADIKPVDLKKDLNLQLRIYFNLPININYNKNDEEHYVKLVQMAPVLIQPPAGWGFIEKASIDLTNPKLKDNNKTLIYEIPIDEIKKLDTNQKWYIKIRAFAESDDTPLNGSRAYAEYKDEPDINHYFYTMPKIDVKRVQVYTGCGIIDDCHSPGYFEGKTAGNLPFRINKLKISENIIHYKFGIMTQPV